MRVGRESAIERRSPVRPIRHSDVGFIPEAVAKFAMFTVAWKQSAEGAALVVAARIKPNDSSCDSLKIFWSTLSRDEKQKKQVKAPPDVEAPLILKR
jgi:hypothetical protein